MKARNYLRKISFKNKQRSINKQYAKEGLSDDVLMKQVELNKQRHKHNISDESQKIYKNYVQ